ncbi:MAG: diaminopimelate epimerase [Arachnia sp.]
MRRLTFHKGHATRNDFVIIDDSHGMLDLAPADVARICDRHSGIGADGVLRVVRAQHEPEWRGDADLWFMDYRNADGSIAEMCGNGLRLFALYLLTEQLVPGGAFTVGTRAGAKRVRLDRAGMVSVDLGPAQVHDSDVEIALGPQRWSARKVDVGNPHAVVFVQGQEIADLNLCEPPVWEPHSAFPEGVNVEFCAVLGPGIIDMRVHERGVGETQSCGTGVVAAAAAYARDSGWSDPVEVHVPGGKLEVTFEPDASWLLGPAVLTAHGEYWG